MPRPTSYTVEQLTYWRSLREQGLTYQQIAEKSDNHRETVRRALIDNFDTKPFARDFRPADFSYLDPIFVAEFRGLFYGEACLTFHVQKTYGRSKRPMIKPCISIAMRDDDEPMVRMLYETFGGYIIHQGRKQPNRHDIIDWKTRDWSKVWGMCLLLEKGILPAKKLKEVPVMIKACALRSTFPLVMSDCQYIQLLKYVDLIRDLKRHPLDRMGDQFPIASLHS